MAKHIPVLAKETLAFLAPQDGGLYLDCTFGGGGHSRLILESAEGARVIALDQDPAAAERAEPLEREFGERFSLRRMNFRDLGRLEEEGFDGILFDLGVSSFQLDEIERGFSFRGEAPLDMRMNPETGLSAADWLRSASRDELATAIRDYGEERNWKRIVNAILAAREGQRLETTTQLADLVLSCTPARLRYTSKLHPATKTFQGIRIAVNDELAAMEDALPAAFGKLKVGGSLCVISFHSLEDRIAKRLFRRLAGRPEPGDHRPQDMRETRAEMLSRRVVTAGPSEVEENARSRSAKLRAIRKLK